MRDLVLHEKRGPVAVLTLNRPEVHNVVDGRVMDRLEELCGVLEADPEVRAVVLAGAGSETFCAGGDLSWFETLDSGGGGAMSRRMVAVLERLTGGPRPVIAALQGNVLGGGCEIALACHLRIAGRGVRFSFRPAALGILTGWGGGVRLFRQVGRGAALRLLLGAETIDAAEALRLGLVERLAEGPAAKGPAVVDEAVAWAERLASHAAPSIAAFLEIDRTLESGDLAAARRLESERFAELWRGEDFRRALDGWRRHRA